MQLRHFAHVILLTTCHVVGTLSPMIPKDRMAKSTHGFNVISEDRKVFVTHNPTVPRDRKVYGTHNLMVSGDLKVYSTHSLTVPTDRKSYGTHSSTMPSYGNAESIYRSKTSNDQKTDTSHDFTMPEDTKVVDGKIFTMSEDTKADKIHSDTTPIHRQANGNRILKMPVNRKANTTHLLPMSSDRKANEAQAITVYKDRNSEGVLSSEMRRLRQSNCSISICRCSSKNGTTIFDCSNNQLTHVPPIPCDCNIANISNNLISSIWISPFFGLVELHTLDLSNNPLSHVTESVFHGLVNLRELYIRRSKLHLQVGLKVSSLLNQLVSLQKFALTFCCHLEGQCPIPCDILESKGFKVPFPGDKTVLGSIQSLEIDSSLLPRTNNSGAGMNVTFETVKMDLENGFVCYYRDIQKDHFVHMSRLEHLSIRNPYITATFTDDVFVPLRNLRSLSIQGNAPSSTLSSKTQEIMHNITKSTADATHLETLQFDEISALNVIVRCDKTLYYLENHTFLTSMYLRNNRFQKFIDCTFPTSLETLHLENNCLSFTDVMYNLIAPNEHLKYIYANGQNKCRLLDHPVQYQYKMQWKYPSRLTVLIFTKSMVSLDINNDTQPVLRHLKHLDLSGNYRISQERHMIPVYFSSLFPNIKHLDLSNCQLTLLAKDCFHFFTKLKRLHLSFNNLGSMGSHLYERLNFLSELEELKLDNNKIESLPSGAFDEMPELRILNLGHNNILKLLLLFKHTLRLTRLDLSHNRISELSKTNIHNLDMIAEHGNLTVDLSGNSFSCHCNTLYMLQWMRKTKVKLHNRNKYICISSRGFLRTMSKLHAMVKHLEKSCTSKTILIIVICVTVTFTLALLIAVAVYRNRWRLRYQYHMTKLQFKLNSNTNEYERIHDFDAFISYASDDFEVARWESIAQLEVDRGLRLCIHERDFLPGEAIAFNISKGIHGSRRTLLFVSRAWLDSKWCLYEMNIARMESLHTDRKVILVVLLEHVDTRRLPLDVLDFIRMHTYLEYPVSGKERDRELFWNKCCDFITEV